MVFDAAWIVNNILLHRDARFPTIKSYLQSLGKKRLTNVNSHPNPLMREVINYDPQVRKNDPQPRPYPLYQDLLILLDFLSFRFFSISFQDEDFKEKFHHNQKLLYFSRIKVFKQTAHIGHVGTGDFMVQYWDLGRLARSLCATSVYLGEEWQNRPLGAR